MHILANICGGQDDVGVQWVQPLLLATAKPVALHFQHQSDHYNISQYRKT
ncbi:hypothetical protein QUF64_04225 [Anaerolineales bacterium HSG6]|nr:hypothetical protein [Anaerolineales bacterium HSG6]